MTPEQGTEPGDRPAGVPPPCFDVFVGGSATVTLVRRTIESTLHTDTFRHTGWAMLGRHALLHVATHDLPDDLVHDRALPVRLASDYPIWVRVRPASWGPDAFQQEATARRVFTVLRTNAWPAVLVHQMRDVLDIEPVR